MPTSTLTSLAILKVNWDKQKKGYLDNFVPILAECIRLSPDEVVSAPALQGQLRAQFGLSLPQNVITKLLPRVKHEGYIRYERKAYHRNDSKLALLQFQGIQRQVTRSHEALIACLIQFCKDTHKVEWTETEAEAALQSYLEEYDLHVLGAAVHGSVIPPVAHTEKGAKYLVGAFVQHLQACHSSDFEYLETVVKGNMLANAVFLPDPDHAERKFRHTSVYIDTPFLMHSLGYNGDIRKAACVELLEMLYATGASLKCFRHTVEEVRGILGFCTGQIERGQPGVLTNPSLEYFLARGYTSTDIQMLAVNLETELEALRISIEETPPYTHPYNHVIGEQQLTQDLKDHIPYRDYRADNGARSDSVPKALERDVASISAIMRLRKGQNYFLVEDCRAILLTDNSTLARVSREFLAAEIQAGSIPPCITDIALTNILWLKRPTLAPDLPRKRIIADCYAATQPNDTLWRCYLSEVEKLKKNGDQSAGRYYMMRHSIDARTVLMETTLGEPEAFTQGTVPEIMKVVEEEVKAEVQSKYEAEAARRESTEKVAESTQKELDEVKQQVSAKESARVARATINAQRVARIIVRSLTGVILVLLALATAYTLPLGMPEIKDAWAKYILFVLLLLILVLSIGNLWKGVTIDGYLRKLEVSITKKVARLFLSLSEPAPGADG